MLDVYIIDRIHRERERAGKQDGRVPLHIERESPQAPEPAKPEKPEGEGERGSVVIDFALDGQFLI